MPRKYTKKIVTAATPLSTDTKPFPAVDDGGERPFVVDDLFRTKDGNPKQSDRLVDIAGAVKHVFSADDIELKSNLKRNQIVALVKAAVWEQEFQTGIGEFAIKYLLKSSVSIEDGKGGGGRQDLRVVLQSILNADRTQDATQRNMDKLLGKG